VGLDPPFFQLRPLQDSTAALQAEFRSELESAVKERWPASFGLQWTTVNAPSGGLVQVLLLRLPIHGSSQYLDQVGATFCLLEANFALELHRQGYALPGTVHFDLPEEESATMHRRNLPESCKTQKLHLTAQSKGRALTFVPQHSDDRAAKKTAAILAGKSKTLGNNCVLYDQDTCTSGGIIATAVYAGFTSYEDQTDDQVKRALQAHDNPTSSHTCIKKQLTSALTQLHRLLPRHAHLASSTAFLTVTIVGPHTLLFRKPSSPTNLGAVALHDVLHSTVLISAAHIKGLSVSLASEKACSVTIDVPVLQTSSKRRQPQQPSSASGHNCARAAPSNGTDKPTPVPPQVDARVHTRHNSTTAEATSAIINENTSTGPVTGLIGTSSPQEGNRENAIRNPLSSLRQAATILGPSTDPASIPVERDGEDDDALMPTLLRLT